MNQIAGSKPQSNLVAMTGKTALYPYQFVSYRVAEGHAKLLLNSWLYRAISWKFLLVYQYAHPCFEIILSFWAYLIFTFVPCVDSQKLEAKVVEYGLPLQ